MTSLNSVFVFVLIAIAFAVYFVAIFMWIRSKASETASFILLAFLSGTWSILYALELGFRELGPTVVCFMSKFPLIVLSTTVWLLFTLDYSGKERWINKGSLSILMAAPLFLLAGILTNPELHLFVEDYSLQRVGYIRVLEKEANWGYWVTVGYSYILTIVGAFIFIRELLFTHKLYSRQAIFVTLGILGALIGNVLGYSPWNPVPGLDWTPICFPISILFIGYALVNLKLFDVVPVARETVFKNMKDPVFVLDEENRVIDFNQAALDLPGVDESDMMGQEAKKALSFLSKKEEVLEGLEEMHDMESEIVVQKKDEELCFHVRITSLYDKNGELSGRVIVLRDITARKKAEEREEFLHSILRHDLGNKLQVIQGYLELLKDTAEIEEQKEYLEDALSGTEQGIDLIENVRTLNRIDLEEEKEPVPLGKMISESVESHLNLAEDEGISIENGVEEDIDVIGGSLLKELFSNLIENAVSHSEGSKIRISSELEGSRVRVTVEDDGIGIADDVKDDVLNRGFKGEGSSGSGLGMFLVKEIVDTYNGDIEIKDSELGGARFDVILDQA